MTTELIPPLPTSLSLRFADVAINRPLEQSYSYSIPGKFAGEVHIGSLVEVPLRTESARGVVTGILDAAPFRGKIKPVSRVLTPDYTINTELMDLARWIADYYYCSLGETLAAVSFIGLNDVHARMKSHLALAAPEHWLAVSREVGPDGLKATQMHARVINALLASGNEPLSSPELRDLAGVGEGVLDTMLKRGWLMRTEEPEMREDDYPSFAEPTATGPQLTPDQQRALDEILLPLHDAVYRTFLLHGVTGSGKTEIYLRAIEEALRLGRTALVLVPEIALTPQTVHVFRSRLGPLAAVYHSRLSLGQKYDLWRRIAAGEVRVLIGARSAIFAPLPNLGVVVVDEEHESAYKQGDTPRYHARDVAVWRANRSGAIAILGSATPSMESFHNAREGKYTLLRLSERIGPHASPVMSVIDMKLHLADGDNTQGGSMISPTLRQAIEKRLAAREQTVLLLNRRGFANHVLCMACETAIGCPHCDVSLTYHKSVNKLVCHWCGKTMALPKKCSKCGKAEIQTLGLGTQRIEETLAAMFPAARILRVDVDTMKGRRSFIDAWQKITKGEVDIILGTQMIAKGFHLESVTLVGVISADFALFLPDFRSAERTYHLLTQAAGRAGRGDRPGEVIVQSFMPHHYAIDFAARLAEKEFYERELHIRRMLRFPPLARLIGILATGEDGAAVREQASRLANMLKVLANRPAYREVKVLGPAPAPIGKIEDRFRWRILLRGPAAGPLHELLRQGLAEFERVHQKGKVMVSVDVDPVDLM